MCQAVSGSSNKDSQLLLQRAAPALSLEARRHISAPQEEAREGDKEGPFPHLIDPLHV